MTGKIGIPHFHLEAERRGKTVVLSLYDALSVDEVSPFSVEVRLRGGGIAVRGERLQVAIFENRSLTVSGRIASMEVLYDPD